MALYTDQIVGQAGVLDEVTRGEAYIREFSFYQNANSAGASSELPPRLGDPLDLSSSQGVIAVGRVVGTDQRITVTATAVSLGAASPPTPARIAVTVDGPTISDLCYREGAEEAFVWTLYHFDASSRLEALITVEVACLESGAGGVSS